MGHHTSGNVITGVECGPDAPTVPNQLHADALGFDPAKITSLAYKDVSYTISSVSVPSIGSITVETFQHGFLTIDGTGSYTYTAPVTVTGPSPVYDILTYTLSDSGGLTSSANLTISVVEPADTDSDTGAVVEADAGTDAGTDADTDNDSDTDPDVDAGTGGSSNDGCGCEVAGAKSSTAILSVLLDM